MIERVELISISGSEMKIEFLVDHPAQVPTLAAWQQEAFGYLNPSITLDERTERLRLSLQKEGLPMTFIALSDDGTPLGSASIFATTITHKHLTPWLSAVYVPAEHRGGGIASALSLRAVAEAARLGYGKLYLFTPRNETLYARMGWQTFEKSEHNGVTLTLMERNTDTTSA